MGLFRKDACDIAVGKIEKVEVERRWMFVEEYTFTPISCHGKPMKVRAYSDSTDSYVLQCDECGKVAQGEISEV